MPRSHSRWAGALLVLVAACHTTRVAPSSPRPVPKWHSLFDGQTLEGWESIPFGGEGEVEWRDGFVRLPMGSPLTGLRATRPLPVKSGFEIEVQAARLAGTDFFCALTFPVAESHATAVLGGWGGALCGLSCLDGKDASENETKSFRRFERERLYTLRVRVESNRVRAWLDDDPLFDVDTTGRELSLRTEVIPSAPLGVSCYVTTADIHSMRWRKLASPGDD